MDTFLSTFQTSAEISSLRLFVLGSRLSPFLCLRLVLSPFLRWMKGQETTALSSDLFLATRRTEGASSCNCCLSGNFLSCICNKEADRLVLKGLFLSCCGLVGGLADSAFAVVYVIFPFPLFVLSCLTAHLAPLKHGLAGVHLQFPFFPWKKRLPVLCILRDPFPC